MVISLLETGLELDVPDEWLVDCADGTVVLVAPPDDDIGFASNILIEEPAGEGAWILEGVDALPGSILLEHIARTTPVRQRGVRFGWASPLHSMTVTRLVIDGPAGSVVATASVASKGSTVDALSIEKVLSSIRQAS